MQLTLISLIFKTIVFDVPDFLIYTPSVDVFIVRFLCATLLHMELIGDVS